jgi:hypothetical protein
MPMLLIKASDVGELGIIDLRTNARKAIKNMTTRETADSLKDFLVRKNFAVVSSSSLFKCRKILRLAALPTAVTKPKTLNMSLSR